jgi:NAD(P)-dependent dehydrogenase (short-subunit alcohol dehydrogenase family)
MANNKVALVTGSSKGIGRSVALALAKAGYDISVHYAASPEQALESVRDMEAAGAMTCLVQGDTGDAAVPERIVKETVEKLGRLDVIVINAGFTVFETITEMKAETIDRIYSVNFRGMVLCAQAAARYMVGNGVKGSIIFNSSVRSCSAHSNDGIYGSLKAGIDRLIQSMAVDLGRYGIRVNGFAPGVINVRVPEAAEKEHAFYKDSPRFVPLRRNGHPEDCNGVVLFLASEASSYVTGQVIRVDGGVSAMGSPDCFDSMRDYFDLSGYLKDAPTFDLDEVMSLKVK